MELVKSSKWFKALAAALLVVAMGIGVNAINIDRAYAVDSSPAITVNIQEDGVIVDSSTVTRDQMQAAGKLKTEPMGFLYCKSNVWNVVGTNSYVNIADLFAVAGFSADWAAADASDYLAFTCTDGVYTKYYPTKAEVDRIQKFFGATTASATDATGGVDNKAVIAYSTNNAPITGTYTASDVLSTVLSGTTTAPRFCMGLVDGDDYTSSLAAGKRMPSNVTEITIVL